MHDSTDSAPTQVIAAAYARHPAGAERTRSRKRYLLAAAGLLAVIAIAGALTAPKWAGRFVDGDPYDGAVHTVEPVDLSIALTEDGELKPRDSVKIKCEVEGQSTILFVIEESTRVKKGDLLVELTSDTLQERLDAKQIELKSLKTNHEAAVKELELQKSQNASNIKKAEIDAAVAELDLKKYINGDYVNQLSQIKTQIQQGNKDIERKERELKEYRELAKKGWATKNDVEDREFALTVAKWQLDQRELSRKTLETFEKPKVLKQRQSTLERAREELARETDRAKIRLDKLKATVDRYESQLKGAEQECAKLRKQIEQCKMFAPADGIVQYYSERWWRSDNRIAIGEHVYKGQTLLELPDTSQMLVKTRINEADRHLVREGMPCVIKVTAAPGETFTGKITKIDKFVDTENRWLNPNLKEHGAEILLDATDVSLSPGESAEVKILVDTLENVLATPVQCVFTRGSRSFVFVERGGEPEQVEVELGKSNSSMVEIVSGLKSGDRVLMDMDEQLLATLPAATAADESQKAIEQKLTAQAAAAKTKDATGQSAADASKAKDATGESAADSGKTKDATGESAADSGKAKDATGESAADADKAKDASSGQAAAADKGDAATKTASDGGAPAKESGD